MFENLKTTLLSTIPINDWLIDLQANNYSVSGYIAAMFDSPTFLFGYVLVCLLVQLVLGSYYAIGMMWLGTIKVATSYIMAVLRPVIRDISHDIGTEVKIQLDRVVLPVNETVNKVIDRIPIVVEDSVESLKRGIHETAVTTNSISLKQVVKNAMDHKIGLATVAHSIVNANSRNEIASEFIKGASLLGMEREIINSTLNAVINAADRMVGATPVRQQALSDLADLVSHNTWTMKRTLGLAGLGASIAGIEVGGAPVLAGLTGAVAKTKALEEMWDKIEEYLNTLGIIQTGKWAYFKELGEHLEAFEKEAVQIGKDVATRPALFCRPHHWKYFQDFRQRLLKTSATLNKNVCTELRSGKILMACQALMTRVDQWATILHQIRSTCGIRPKPAGVVIYAPESQIGKSTLADELIKRHNRQLATLYEEDPETHVTFQDAAEWTTWNMSVRDEYDQNYAGNEVTYVDDAFSAVANEDHQMWLTFISNEAIGTKQADLSNKGLAYVSRLCVASCNTLPTSSVTINNIHALHQRFPFTAYAEKVCDFKRDAQGNIVYDPDFSHLRLHVGPMAQHCWLNKQGCTNDRIDPMCGPKCRTMTVQELVDEICVWQVKEESYFISQLESRSPSIAVEQMMEDDFYEMVSSDGSETSSANQRRVDALCDSEVESFLFGDNMSESPSNSVISDVSELFGNAPATPQSLEDNVDITDPVPSTSTGGFTVPTFRPISPSEVSVREECPDITSHGEQLIFNENEIFPQWVDQRTQKIHNFKEPLTRVREPTTMGTIGGDFGDPNFKPGFRSTGCVYKLVEHIELAYERAKLEDPGDYRIMVWAQHLRHKTTKSLLRDDIRSGNFTDAYQLFLCLTTYEIIPERMAEFIRAFSNFCKVPWRIYDSTLVSCYLWSFKFNGGTQLILVPDLDEGEDPRTNPEFKVWSTYLRDFEVSQITLSNGFRQWRWKKQHMVREIREMTFMRIYMTLIRHDPKFPTFWAGGLYRDLPYYMPNIARSGQWTNTRFMRLNQVCNYTIDVFFTVPAVVISTLCWIRQLGSIMADWLHFCVLRILTFCGLDIGQTVYDLTDLITKYAGGLTTMGIISVLAAIVYSIYKLIWGNPESLKDDPKREASEQGYEGKQKLHKARTMRIRRVKQQLLPGARFPELEDGKIDYYINKDLPCIFCNNSWGKGDVIMETDFLLVKENLFTPEDCEEAFVCVWKREHQEHITTQHDFKTILGSTAMVHMELGSEPGQVHMEQGFYAQGSVPHLHTKIYNCDDTQSFFSLSKTCDLNFKVFEQDKERCVAVGLKCTRSDWVREIVDRFWPLVSVSKSFSLRVEFLDEISCTAFLFCTGTITDGVDRTLFKRDIKKLRSLWEAASGITAGEAPSRQIVSQLLMPAPPFVEALDPIRMKPPTKEQSLDDVALDTIRLVTDRIQVMIVRTYRESDIPTRRYMDFGKKPLTSLRTAGLGYKGGVIMPAHITGGLNSFVRVYNLGTMCMKTYTNYQNDQYQIAQVINIDHEADIAYAILVTPQHMEIYCWKNYGITVNTDNAIKKNIVFSDILKRHLMTDGELEKVSSRHFPVVQWMPASGLAACYTVKLVGSLQIMFEKEGLEQIETRHHIMEAVSIFGESVLTIPGDCGGLYAVMDPKQVKKIVGMHIAGSDTCVYATILTLERLETMVADPSRSVALQYYCDDIPASTLCDYDSSIPPIVWADDDCWSALIGKGRPIVMPEGPDVVHVGNVRVACPPTSCKSGNFLGDWVKSPFAGAFEEVLAPGVLHVKDPRIKVDLPLDGMGRPSIVLKQNQPFGLLLPQPDLVILRFIERCMTFHFQTLLVGKQIGNHLDVHESLDMGLNGSVGNRFITGIDVNKASGYPWSSIENFKKKSDLIQVDDKTGHRTFTELGEKSLRPRVIYSLLKAMSGIRVLEMCADKLKDTCVKLKHVANAKTRTFNNTPVERLVISNIINGNMREHYTQLFLKGHHFIGGDPLSIHWQQLYDHLNVHPNWVYIDYENFDRRQSKYFGILAESVWNNVINLNDRDDYHTARWVESANAIESLMIDDTTIWMTGHGNKSGDPRTTPRNNLVNMANLLYVWYSNTQGTFAEFLRNTSMVFFGDDAVITVSDEFAHVFNYNTIAKTLHTVGHIVTPGNKAEGEIPNFVDKSEVTFLKRYFRFKDGICIAPLEKSSIEAPFVWTQNTPYDYQIWQQLVCNNLIEACLWGKQYFDEFHGKLMEGLMSDTFPLKLRTELSPYINVTYEEVWEEFKIKRFKL